MKVYQENGKYYGIVEGITIQLKTINSHGAIYACLPKGNDSLREYINVNKIPDIATSEAFDIPIRTSEKRTLSSKKLEDFMTEEEKNIIAEIYKKCEERRAQARPLTEKEKLEREIERLKLIIEAQNAKIQENKAE